ncbi:type II toxin-antitoxin system HigB family toxin [Janthinobacterium agaricidamnosum]|uniref:mRNA interferase HigB n=1 Tax=Janthinobacterium agaricidamnosum NBRC 102515 = DSM 9628 TaxID=1349767 RepID=W0VCU3_9BURK|nr:type II toxin-antitoxin system HigB family toxin [Janthinobacterium agaricidamnosum]CDG85122.1 putative uncharacterized protein [Janthinobacterium agaricidamnosum NBRC 102515 = DSM 9628]
MIMRLVANRALLDFSARYHAAEVALQTWRKVVESRAFANFSELRSTFNTVDRVGAFDVFDIGGNKYRIVAAIHFNRQIMYIRHVFTHQEYDAWAP